MAEIGRAPMAAMRAQVCAWPVAARGGAAVAAELATLLRIGAVPPLPPVGPTGSTAGAAPMVYLELPDVAVVRRLSRLAAALGVPVRGVQVAGPVTHLGGRSAVTGLAARPQRWLRLRVQLGPVAARLRLFAADGRLVSALPPGVLVGGRAAAVAGWRAALLARGEWSLAASPPVLGLVCPTYGVAAELVALARVLQVQAVLHTLDRGAVVQVGPAPRAGGNVAAGAEAMDDHGPTGDIARLLAVVGASRAAGQRPVAPSSS